MRVRTLVSLAVLFAFCNRFALSAAAVPAPIPFTLTGSGQVLVPALVNGSGPYLFVLDTGANRSAISSALAERLSLRPVAVTEIVTSSGSAMGSVVKLQSISLGSRDAPDVLTAVLAMESLKDVHAKADGIIGQDVLVDAHYTLDYRQKKVIWRSHDTDAGAGTRLALRRVEGRLLVGLPQSSREDDVAWMVPDSGASTLVLFEHGGRTKIPAAALAVTVRTATVIGSGDVQAATVPKLRIGNAVLWDQPAVLIAGREGEEGFRPDGLLPLSGFSAVTFNGPANYLTIR
jgi:predicted aspartyl protease